MFFTREDILKIQQALLQLGVKDSELPSAEPITYDDTLSIVQDGKNKQIGVKDFFNQISLWKREDFLNITDRYDEHYIMLLEAINLVPVLQRKDGLVITFQDTNGDWRIYQFRGNITEFLNEEKWFDLYDYRNYIIKSFVPDEEDITALTPDENGNSFLALKDRIYDPTIFSGKGYKFVRKNIINVELATIKISVINPTTLEGDIYFNINNKGTKVHLSPTIHNTTKLVSEAIKDVLVTAYNDYEVTVVNSVVTLTRKYSGNVSPTTFEMYNTGIKVIVEDTTIIEERNVITQEDINEEDTIYEIRYDFDLDGKTITIPNNCVLYFTSGKFYNGSINMDNTIVSTLYEDVLSEVNINGNYYNIQKHIKDYQSQLDDKQAQIDDKQQQITANDEDISLLQTRSTQMEETIESIAVTGGASQATAVTYKNTDSGLNSITAQGAIDELAAKNQEQDAAIGTKAEKSEVTTELDKKFNKENIAQEFGDSKDKVVSQFALPFREIESPEFIKAIVDAEDHFLFGIQLDGSIEWGKGIPAPIKAKLQEIINQCQQDKTDLLESISTLNSILNKTTIKDEESNVQDTPFRVIENEEFIKAIVDAEDKVLFGIYRATGKPYYPQNDMYHISQSEEFLWVILDAANHPLLGIQQDGTCWAAKAQWLDDIEAIKEVLSSIDETLKTFQPKEDGKGLINLDVADSFFYISNDEYIIAVVDAENRILLGIKYDGEPYFPNHEMYSVITNEEWLYAIIDAEDKVLGGFRADDGHMVVGGMDIANAIINIADIKERTAHFSTTENDEYLSVETDADGKVIGYIAHDGSHYLYKVKSETIPTEFSHIEDPDGRTEITTDSEGKLLGYRDSEGVRHENSLSIEHLEASDEIFNMFSKRLNLEKSFSKFGDLSDYDNIKMIIPDCAFVNIFTVGGNTNFPETKQSNLKCYMQFTDNRGIYFKKKIIANAQGNSSLGDPKKNLAIDICNDDWIGDNTCTITFGNWVPQDSFHLKAYYSDTFVGIPAIGYKLFNEIVKTRGVQHDRNWKRALKLDAGIVPSVLANEDISKRLDSGARCFPDAFPCVLFIEGRFYGIYSWQLKKHRDNYAMDKKNALNIHLDGAISSTSFFCANGNIDWDIWNAKKEDANHLKDGIEIRNPKSLIGIDGSKYNFDTNAVELIDENSELYDEGNKDMVRSAKVKSILIDATKHIPNILELVNTNETTENIRAKIEEYFDVESIIDYIIFSDLTQNIDGLLKNWQWTTYDGIVWSVSPYDLDWTFGLKGTQEGIPSSSHLSSTTNTPYGLVCKFYKEELTARYTQLRNQGIINTNHITDMLNNWVKSVGMEYYVLEQKTWKDKRKDNIYRFANWVSKSIECFDIFYKYNK